MRIGNYEDGVTGRHHAARVLEPFIASIVSRRERPARGGAVVGHRARSTRSRRPCWRWCAAASSGVPLDVTVFYTAPEPLDATARGPAADRSGASARRRAYVCGASARDRGFDYVLLFESSGMYRGEETVPLLAQLATGRLDAVWGSRRLSVRDIEESYRFRYSASALGGTISYLGSYALSLACLVLYGRYITDTLSGVRAIRAADVLRPARRSRAQEREPRAAVAAAAAQGRDPGNSRCVSSRSPRTG